MKTDCKCPKDRCFLDYLFGGSAIFACDDKCYLTTKNYCEEYKKVYNKEYLDFINETLTN